jgi:hypothetical protein
MHRLLVPGGQQALPLDRAAEIVADLLSGQSVAKP